MQHKTPHASILVVLEVLGVGSFTADRVMAEKQLADG